MEICGGDTAPQEARPAEPKPGRARPGSRREVVQEANLARYFDLLEFETDAETRERLLRLLVEELDRFGSLVERFERSELLIRRARARVDHQKVIVSELAGNGADTRAAIQVLDNLVFLVTLMEDYRALMGERLDMIRP